MIDDSLVCCWSGALERSGEAPGLSSYRGRSSIYHSASWAASEDREAIPIPLLREKHLGRPSGIVERRRRYVPTVEGDAAILEKLRRGVSYRAIAKACGVSVSLVMRLAQQHGIDRRGLPSNLSTYTPMRPSA